MGRRAAKALHLALFLVGVVLYVLFVLPRWWVLTGDIPTPVATAGRIAAGIPIALAAMPVLAILRLALSRKAKTPELALRLRAWSAVLHVVAGVLILVTAVVEIWLRLAVGGPFLFAVYGAAGAIAILGVLALYLSFVAEKPPAAPKPPKPAKPAKVKKVKATRGEKQSAAASEEAAADETATTEPDETGEEEPAVSAESDGAPTSDEDEAAPVADDEPGTTAVIESNTDAESDAESDVHPESGGALRNKRPAGKNRPRLRR
jgi:cytochrome b561